MLEVMEKADRLHVDQPMRRSMGEASTSDDSSIRFNEVTQRLRLCLLQWEKSPQLSRFDAVMDIPSDCSPECCPSHDELDKSLLYAAFKEQQALLPWVLCWLGLADLTLLTPVLLVLICIGDLGRHANAVQRRWMW